MSTKILFPYQYKIINNERLADPFVYLNVNTQFGIRKVGFLVDSGSDTVILPLSPYRFWFNFIPRAQDITILGGVEGRGVTAYPGRITLQINKENIETRCYFVKSDTMPLLGRLDIWDKFNWFFDNKRQQVVFYYPDLNLRILYCSYPMTAGFYNYKALYEFFF